MKIKYIIFLIQFIFIGQLHSQIIATIKHKDNIQYGSIELQITSGAAPYYITWTKENDANFSSNSTKIDNLLAGTYCVTILDKNCCSAKECFIVKDISTCAITIPPLDPCFEFGNSNSIKASYLGNPTCSDCTFIIRGPNYSNAGGINMTNIPSGPFSIEVVKGTCSASVDANLPYFNIAYVNNSACSATVSTGKVGIFLSGKDRYKYSIYKLGNNPIKEGIVPPFASNLIEVSNLVQGDYQVRVDNLDFPQCAPRYLSFSIQCCSELSNIVLTTPKINFANGDLKEGSISLSLNNNIGPVYCSWTFNDKSISGGKKISNLSAGKYCVTVTSATGCESATACYNVPNSCDDIQLNATLIQPCGTSSTIYASGEIKLDPDPVFGPYEYLWDNGTISNSLTDIKGIGDKKLSIKSINQNCTTEKTFSVKIKSPELSWDLITIGGKEICRSLQTCNGVPIPQLSYEQRAPTYKAVGKSECTLDMFCGSQEMKRVEENTEKEYLGIWAKKWLYYRPDYVTNFLNNFKANFGNDNPCAMIEYCPIDGVVTKVKKDWRYDIDHVYDGPGPDGLCVYTVWCGVALVVPVKIREVLLPCWLSTDKTGIFWGGEPYDPQTWGYPEGTDICSLQDLDHDNVLDSNDCCCTPLKKDICCPEKEDHKKYDFDEDGVLDYFTEYNLKTGQQIVNWTDNCIPGLLSFEHNNCVDENNNLIDDNVDMNLICSLHRPSSGRLTDYFEILNVDNREYYIVYGGLSNSQTTFTKGYDTERIKYDNEYYPGEHFFKTKQLKDSSYIVAKTFTSDLVNKLPDVGENKGGYDVTISRIRKDGSIIWVNSWGSANDEKVKDLYVDENDNISILLDVEKSITINDKKINNENGLSVLVKLDKNGIVNSLNDIQSVLPEGSIEASGVLTDKEDYSLILFQSEGQTQINSQLISETDSRLLKNVNILKMSPTGTIVWNKQITAERGTFFNVKIEKIEEDFLVLLNVSNGAISSTLFTDPKQGKLHIFRIDKNGNLVWSKSLSNQMAGAAITVDENSNIFVGGVFEGNVNIADQQIQSKGNKDIFIIKMSPLGEYINVKSEGGYGLDYLKDIKSNKHGQIIYVGEFYGDSAQIGGIMRSGLGDNLPKDYLAFYNLPSNDSNSKEEAKMFAILDEKITIKKVYPNPFNQYFNVDIESFSNQEGYMTIIDMLGRVVQEQKIQLVRGINTMKLHSNNLSGNTMYQLIIKDSEHNRCSEIILKM